jgi:hypothetical protein
MPEEIDWMQWSWKAAASAEKYINKIKGIEYK